MSTIIINTSSSLPRPYIGSCRNRNYIYNKSSSLLLNDYYFSTIRSSNAFLPNQFKQRIYLLNGLNIDGLREQVPIKHSSSLSQLDERQLNQEQKGKGFLSSTSSSLFLFPTLTPPTYYDRSSSSFITEEKQIPNHHINSNHSFSLSNLLNDNNGEVNQSCRLTSIPIHPSISYPNLTINNNNILDRLLISGNVFQLNNMSSLRYSSSANSKTHSYDQRISDQGNKYIIQLKTDDYQENEFTITPCYYHENQLIIDAKHNEEDSFGGFIRRELHKIFLIPKHIDLTKHTYSYNKKTQELTIEMPYLQSNINEIKSDSSFISPMKNTSQSLTFSYGDINLTNGENILPTIHFQSDHNSSNISGVGSTMISAPMNESSIENTKPFDFDLFHRSAFRPQIIQSSTNENKLSMSLDLSGYQPEDIKISVKDQELIVKAERKFQTDTKKSHTSFFQSTTLPPQTDIEHLQSNYIDGKLIIEAPYLDQRNKTNEETVIKSQQKSINNDPYQQRTETVIEFVRLRRF